MNQDIMRAAGMGDFVDKVNEGKCPWCGSTKLGREDFKNEISFKEFGISGLCQECQDGFFE